MQKILHHPVFDKCAYKDIGEGFPVILIHGFPEDGSIFSSQENYLQNKYRLIIPDLPGSGSSPLADNLTIELMAEFIHAVLSAEKIDQCIMIGHSMGGYITLAFAEKYAHLLKGFGFFNSTALPDSEEKKQGRMRSVEFMQNHTAAIFVRQMMPGLFSSAFKNKNPDAVNALVKHSEHFKTKALIAYYYAMMQRPDRRHVLQQATVPVLFLIGKEDTVIPLDNILPQVTLPAMAVVNIFSDTGHMSMVETPVVNPALSHYINFCTEAPFQ